MMFYKKLKRWVVKKLVRKANNFIQNNSGKFDLIFCTLHIYNQQLIYILKAVIIIDYQSQPQLIELMEEY